MKKQMMNYPDDWTRLGIVVLIMLIWVLASCTKSGDIPSQTVPMGIILIDPGTHLRPDIGNPITEKATTPNRMPNGGGEGQMDWYDENANGCGDMWTYYPPLPGFAWQNFTATMTGADVTQCVTAQSQFILISPTPPVKSSIHNVLTFRYRSTTSVTVVVRLTGRCGFIVARLPRSEWRDVSVSFAAYAVHSIMWYNSPTQPGVLEVDKVNLY